jgi:hypothetical protein
MRFGDIDKVKYNIHQIDHLLPQSLVELLEKWKSDSCPVLKVKLSCDKVSDFDLPKTMGELKTAGLEKGVVFLFHLFLDHTHDHSLPIFIFMMGDS